MAAKINLFPTLTEELKSRMRFQTSDYEFFYTKEDNEFLLQSEEIDCNQWERKVVDKKGIWAPDDCNLCIRRRYSIRTYQCLFGKDGIVCSNAIIGIALRWTSSDSRQRGVIEIGSLRNSAEDKEFLLEYEFPAAQLRGSLELSSVLYLKRPGTPLWEEEHLSNICGCILGELDKITVRLDGIGSEFPVYEVNDLSRPLWYINCDWEDPTNDQFIECVSVFLNKAHKNYKFLEKDEQLLKEIMASALFLLITKLKTQEDYWNDTIEGNNLLNGSVSAAVNYFIKTLGWNVSNPESLSISIRNYFDKRM